MTRLQAYAIPLFALLVGIGIGTFGTYRYAKNAAGRQVLAMLHQDAATTLKSYERIRQMVENKDDEKLLRYLNGVIDVQSATVAGTSDPNTSSAHD